MPLLYIESLIFFLVTIRFFSSRMRICILSICGTTNDSFALEELILQALEGFSKIWIGAEHNHIIGHPRQLHWGQRKWLLIDTSIFFPSIIIIFNAVFVCYRYLKHSPFVQSSSPNVDSVVISHDWSPHMIGHSKYHQTSKNQQTP